MDPMADASTVERALMSRATVAGIPINGSIELLPLCNMNCRMCYVRMDRSEMEKIGRLKTVEEWLSIGAEMRKAGVLFLLLTGGEPLLYPGFKEVYLGLKEMGMILTINTNGTLIDEEWADFFAANKPRRINITLYGPDEEIYEKLCGYGNGFRRTIRAVKLLKEREVDVKLASSAAKANGDVMEEILAVGRSLDVPIFVDTYMMPAERERNHPYDMQSRLDPVTAAKIRIACLKQEMGEELFAEYVARSLNQVETFLSADDSMGTTCHAGKCSFTVNWQGQIRPCVIMGEPSFDVETVGFEESWRRIQAECRKMRIHARCSTCRLRPICRTCPACGLLETGSYDGLPQYMCDYAEESYRLLLEEADRLDLRKEEEDD